MSIESNSDFSDEEAAKKPEKSFSNLDKGLRLESLSSQDAIKNNASSFFVINTDILSMPLVRLKSREGKPWGKIADSILNPLGSKNRILLRKLLNIQEGVNNKKSLLSTVSNIKFGANSGGNKNSLKPVLLRKKTSKMQKVTAGEALRKNQFLNKSFTEYRENSFSIEDQTNDDLDLKTAGFNRKKSCDCSECGKPTKFQQRINKLLPTNPVKYHQMKKYEKRVIRRNASYASHRSSLTFGRSIKIISNLKKIQHSVQRKSKKFSFSMNFSPFKPVEKGFLGLNLKQETVETLNRELGMSEPKSSLLKKEEKIYNASSPKTAKLKKQRTSHAKKGNESDPELNAEDKGEKTRTRAASPNLNKQITLNQLALLELFSPKKARRINSIQEAMEEDIIEIKPLDKKLLDKIELLQKRYSMPNVDSNRRSSLEKKVDPKKMLYRTGSLMIPGNKTKEFTRQVQKRKNSILNESSRKELTEEGEGSGDSSSISQDFKMIEERLNLLRMEEEQQRRKEKVSQFYNNQRLKRDTVMSEYVDQRMKSIGGETESKISGTSGPDFKAAEIPSVTIGNSIKISHISKESVFRNKDVNSQNGTTPSKAENTPILKSDISKASVIHKLYAHHNKALSLPKLDAMQLPFAKTLLKRKSKKKTEGHAKTNTFDAFAWTSHIDVPQPRVWPFSKYKVNPRVHLSGASTLDFTEVELKTNATAKSAKSFEKSFQAYNIKDTPSFKKKLNSLLGPAKLSPLKKEQELKISDFKT